MHFECLISLLFLFDAHQVVLCTLLQHVLILDSYVYIIGHKYNAWGGKVGHSFINQSSTDLLETLQDSLHVLVPPEKVSEGAFDRVEVGDGLISLCC